VRGKSAESARQQIRDLLGIEELSAAEAPPGASPLAATVRVSARPGPP
jgi:hypothetical protein